LIVLKQSSARKLPVLLVDSGGAVKADVAEIDVTVVTSKNGGALTGFTLTDKWTELGQGLYTIDFAAGDLDTEGFFAYLVTVTGCDQYSGIMYVSDWETNVDSILEDTATTLPASITTTEGNIRGADSDTLKTLSEQLDPAALEASLTAIKGDGWTDENLTTIDSLIDGIKAKTDNLPTDPADESLLEAELLLVETNVKAAITDAEGNIRGGGDNLDTVSDQIDYIIPALNAIKGAGWTDENLTTIDSLIDAIKAKTDNLPVDPADESLLEAAITVVDNNLASLAIDIVGLLSADITDARDVVTAVLTAMKGAGWTTETLKIIKDAVDANGNDIDDAINNQTIMDGKLTAIKVIDDYLKQKESGRWKIENNQLTYYDDDGTTILRRFNLFNKQGQATSENPYERVPI